MTDPSSPNDLDIGLRRWGREQHALIATRPRSADQSAPAHRWRAPAARWPLVAAAVAAAVVALAVTAAVRLPGYAVAPAAGPAAAPVPVVTTADVRTWISAARLDRPLLFDGGALRLDPPTSPGGVGELRALALWRAGGGRGGSHETVSGVSIVRADITLSVPLLGTGAVEPSRPATFGHRTGWVVVYDYSAAAASCPSFESRPVLPAPASLPVWLVSADGTAAVDYTTAGRGICGAQNARPSAQPAGVTTTLVRGQGMPPSTCSLPAGTNGGVTYAFTLLAPAPCTTGSNLGHRVGLDPAQRLGSLTIGRVTAPDGGTTLTYYDGAVRRLP